MSLRRNLGMQKVGTVLDANRELSTQLFEPSQPDIAPRSNVVVPDRECDWLLDIRHQKVSGVGANRSPHP